jgi:hypothetical protein
VSYELFHSSGTTTAMLWVVEMTEIQRAAGSIQCTAVGTIAVGTSTAGTIDLGVVGTGQAFNSAGFAANTAYNWSGITAIPCAGLSLLHVGVKFSVADFRSQPTLSLVPMLQYAFDSNWYAGPVVTVYIGGAPGAGLQQDVAFSVDGAIGAVILIESIGGQTPSVTIVAEAC